MKTRIDFVSNSSSSSFIVITDSGREMPRLAGAPARRVSLPDKELGETEFGWQTEKYDGFGDKLNWCAVVVSEKRDMEKRETPEDRLKEEVARPWFRAAEMEKKLKSACRRLGYDVDVPERAGEDPWDYGYIDHQSSIREEPRNARMFETEKTLFDFLANSGSYIDNSNDNGGRDDDEYDFAAGRYASQPEDYYRVEPAPRIETGAYDDILKEF